MCPQQDTVFLSLTCLVKVYFILFVLTYIQHCNTGKILNMLMTDVYAKTM